MLVRKFVVFFWPFFLLFSLISCNELRNPIIPSVINDENIGQVDKNSSSYLVSVWSPYLLVHPNGEALKAYDDIFATLTERGLLRGIRTNLLMREIGESKPTIRLARKYGLDVMGIMDVNDYLNPDIYPDVEGNLDLLYRTYPDIDYYQVGNEVTIGGTVNVRPISIQQYMLIFNRIRDHTRENYSGITLVTQSSFSGLGGAQELEEMINMGLLKNSNRHNLIVSINIYSKSNAASYGSVVRQKVGTKFRVWVTESGVNDWTRQVSYVRDVYPYVRTQVGTDRIYWYCAWCGDFGEHADFSLIRNVANGQPLLRSPLYDALVGSKGGWE